MPPQLIIFDCDGVLVDSEMLSARVLNQQLSEIGIELTFDDFKTMFLGRSFVSAKQRLFAATGKLLPDSFQTEYFVKLNQLFATDLQPMPGVHSLLDALDIDHCVASSSVPPRLDFAIKKCGLEKYFGPRVYSAVLVENAKPAPDLFLYAAQQHNVEPRHCLVIEDSEMGVRAAKAAGMAIWHFAGGAHVNAGYSLPADIVVDRVVYDMQELFRIFCDTGICRGQQKTSP
jgi:HAD superfamily hydrolase (TIGR01509 family)